MTDASPLWYTFLHAVFDRDYTSAEALLKATPDLIRMTDGMGETVLHFLAVEDAIDGVAWLHGRGADLNTTNKFGTPALFEVGQLGYRELFLWFENNGANLQAVDAAGQDIFEYLLLYDQEDTVQWLRTRHA